MVIGVIFTIAGIVSYFHPLLVIPTWAWFLIALLFISIAQFLVFHKVRIERDEARGGVDLIIGKLRNIKVLVDNKEKDAATIFYESRDELVRGISKDPNPFSGTPSPFYTVCLQLDGFKLIRLNQNPGSFGWDSGYWFLTDLGRDVLTQLENNPPISHKAGYPN
jgi:hypothetical protein